MPLEYFEIFQIKARRFMLIEDIMVWIEAFASEPLRLTLALMLLSLFFDTAAVITAGLMVGMGLLSGVTTTAALATAILAGDCAVYLFGYMTRELPWAARWLPSSGMAKLEAWVTPKQTEVLLLSRIIPGSRSIVYLVFGYLHLSPTRFITVAGLGGVVWCTVIMAVVSQTGQLFAENGWMVSAGAGILAAGLVLIPARIIARKSDHADILKQVDR
ncbi:DedA family protein [Kordiimonas sp.]|uniref:DedA family protein n=1 Tax=Kordiimonas sp. TaxID=1970157 RepID=UPI003A933A62